MSMFNSGKYSYTGTSANNNGDWFWGGTITTNGLRQAVVWYLNLQTKVMIIFLAFLF